MYRWYTNAQVGEPDGTVEATLKVSIFLLLAFRLICDFAYSHGLARFEVCVCVRVSVCSFRGH